LRSKSTKDQLRTTADLLTTTSERNFDGSLKTLLRPIYATECLTVEYFCTNPGY